MVWREANLGARGMAIMWGQGGSEAFDEWANGGCRSQGIHEKNFGSELVSNTPWSWHGNLYFYRVSLAPPVLRSFLWKGMGRLVFLSAGLLAKGIMGSRSKGFNMQEEIPDRNYRKVK